MLNFNRYRRSACFAFFWGCLVLSVMSLWIWSYSHRIGWILSSWLDSNRCIRTDWLLIDTGRLHWSRGYYEAFMIDKNEAVTHRRWYRFCYDPTSLRDDPWNYQVETSRSGAFNARHAFGIWFLSYTVAHSKDHGCELAIPCSYLFAAASLFFLLSARAVMRQRTAGYRQKTGLCLECGYDLALLPTDVLSAAH